MEDDWVFLGDGSASGSDTDSAFDAGSDSGFTIVRRGRKGGDAGCSVVADDDAPAPVAAVAVPHPTPPGLSFKVMSYSEAFSGSGSASSCEDDGGDREQQPGCSDEATSGEAIVQGAGIHDAATDDCTVTCKEGCESGQVGEQDHDGTWSYVEVPSAPYSFTFVLDTTYPHSELPSAVGQEDAEISGEEVEKEDSDSCEEDEDDTENSSEDEDDTDSSSSSDEDTDSSGDDEEDEDTDSSGEDEDEEDEDTDSSGDEDTFSSSDEEYTESFSDEEEYMEEIYSEEEDDDVAECSGEEEEEDGSESCAWVDYVERSAEEEVPSTNDDMDTENSDSGSDMDTDSSGSDMDTDISDEEDNDCLEAGEEADIVDVVQNGNQDIFAMLFPKAKACGASMEDCEDKGDVAEIGNQDIFALLLPKDKARGANMDGCDIADVAENGYQDIFAVLLPKEKACGGANTNDCDIADVAENGNQDIFAMLFPKAKACGGGSANMDGYKNESEHGNIDDYEEEEEDGSLFDMLLPKDHAIHDDIDADSSGTEDNCLESDEEEDGVVENGDQFMDMLLSARLLACHANIDDYEDESECQCWEFACQSQTERQALWKDLRRVLEDFRRRQLAAEAFEPSGQQQQRSYDDVDDTCDVPGIAAPGGGPAPAGSCACAPTLEAQFTAPAVRDRERELLAMEEARRREAAQLELDRALAREATAAAQALEAVLQGCPTAKRQASGDVTRPAVAERDVPVDITFIIGVYVLMYLGVSILSLWLSY